MDLLEFCKKNEDVPLFIYGYNALALQIKAYVESEGGKIYGFVVSDGYKVQIDEEKIWIIDELTLDIRKNCAIIIAVKSIHFNDIIPKLVQYNLSNLYFINGAKEFCGLQKYNYFYRGENLNVDEIYQAQEHYYQVAKRIGNYVFSFLNVNSVVDFGCGAGTWLKAFRDIKPSIQILGLDSSDVNRQKCLKKDEFIFVDFETFMWEEDVKYDLAISIEVAEHIEKENADKFVDSICKSSDVVLFGAAVQYQGGDHHVNEQNPSYWVGKFEERGYRYIDCIRPHFWHDEFIDMIYKENIILYVKSSLYDRIYNSIPKEEIKFMDWIHPDLYINKMELALDGYLK